MSKPVERIVEIVGQKHRFELALLRAPASAQSGSAIFCGGRVVERFPVLRRDRGRRRSRRTRWAISTSQLYWIVFSSGAERSTSRPTFSFGSRPGSSICALRHAGRMGQLGVIVIAQDVGQRRRGRRVRVDVRVRIDQHQRVELIEQTLAKGLGHRFIKEISGVYFDETAILVYQNDCVQASNPTQEFNVGFRR